MLDTKVPGWLGLTPSRPCKPGAHVRAHPAGPRGDVLLGTGAPRSILRRAWRARLSWGERKNRVL